jgi:hypothetical protein
MTNILIPTDFSAGSVKFAEDALNIAGSMSKCNIVFFHAFEIPSFPFELLGERVKDPSGTLMTEDFRLACKQLKNENIHLIGKINVRCMKGSTRPLFRNFVDANDIDLIYCPEDFVFVPVHERSVDPLPLFKKCGVPLIKTVKHKSNIIWGRTIQPALQVSSQ